jgi:phosphoserine phosphatase
MLQAVTHPHGVNPAPRLRQAAEQAGWPCLQWQLAETKVP